MNTMKRRISTINWTRLWRKPGQVNRLGNGFASNGTVIIDGFDFPECCRHECGIGVTELACGSATEPDKSLVPQQVVSLHWEKCSMWHSTRILVQSIKKGEKICYE